LPSFGGARSSLAMVYSALASLTPTIIPSWSMGQFTKTDLPSADAASADVSGNCSGCISGRFNTNVE
jgi:hypothetical protein